MKVLSISPRGYCYGVVDAMVLVRRIADNPLIPRPIHVLGMLVHNRQVSEAFAEIGVVSVDGRGKTRLDLLDEITEGTVIFTAHGVSPEVRLEALRRGLHVEDATCPDVTRTHDLLREHIAAGGSALYVGVAGHPEPEGACGVAPGAITLVETVDDVLRLDEPQGDILVTNQTTMSMWDIAPVIEAIQKRFPRAMVHSEICLATQVRQEAVAEQAQGADLLVVVGDKRSNNSQRLAEVGSEIAGVPVVLVSSVAELDPAMLPLDGVVAVTSGASTPTAVTREVIAFLKRFDGSQNAPISAAIGAKVLPSLRARLNT